MRVLQVVTLLTPDGAFGGPARVALNLSAELQRRGHDVTLAAAARGYDSAPTTLAGVRVRTFTAHRVVPNRKFSGLVAPGLTAWFRAVAEGFDIVHIHFGRDLVVLPVAQAARRQQIPYVLQTHGMVVPSRHPLAAPLDALFTRRALRDAGTILFLTDTERRQLTAVAGDRLRLAHLGNGVPEYRFTATYSDLPEVLFAARLQARKQPLLFVAMARRLKAAGVRARFTMIGPDGGEGPNVAAAIAGDPDLVWTGALPPEQLPERMAAASVFVLPSVREPYPMAVLEAMAVGVPVVVTDDCGLAPMVSRTACGIVACADATALADAVSTILGDPVLATDMGGRARATARSEFGMATVAEQVEGMYAQVLVGNS